MKTADYGQIVRKFRKERGLNQFELAERIGVTQPTISKWEKGGEPRMQHWREFQRLAHSYGFDTPDLSQTDSPISIPLIGKVGVGSVVGLLETGHEPRFVPAPQDATDKTVALEVTEGGLRPLVQDGWIIYYNEFEEPPLDEMIGQLCVIGVEDGRMVVKHMYKNKNRVSWDLVATDGSIEKNVEVRWAALVEWIKPR